MKKQTSLAIIIGKILRYIIRLRGSGGSALPGLVVEKLQPSFLSDTLSNLPDGVVVVTGTNGKTTTTKMIADLLSSLGKKVLTNSTGSNFTRGIVAMIVKEARIGQALDHDIAVIELDEAYARRFVKDFKPAYVVALNVMRDQLDRFGEIDTTAEILKSVLAQSTEGCVINGNDPHLTSIAKTLKAPISYYAVDKSLQKYFPTDAELLSVSDQNSNHRVPLTDVELSGFNGQKAEFKISGKVYKTTLQVTGLYNFQNAAAAIALTRLVLPNIKIETILHRLSQVTPAFGRGESFKIGGQPLEVVLVKNPAGFRLAIKSFLSKADIMIAINDQYADGRDVSWLWDVDFTDLKSQKVTMISGIRAYDMALRLRYDEVSFKDIETDLNKALQRFIEESSDQPKRIYCTYTAMLSLYARLAKLTGTERTL